MNRNDFEALRDMPGKVIRTDIRFVQRRQTQPALMAENIEIENSSGTTLRLHIAFNPEVGSKTFNVTAMGIGPICRLDIDGRPHRPAGRCHKHSLQTERCSERNLPDGVIDRGDLTGKSVRELFGIFCEMANITFDATFFAPEGD